jgi:outer membrane protein assembly factor BamB/predicted MPP superfamily phosphohydrolase
MMDVTMSNIIRILRKYLVYLFILVVSEPNLLLGQSRVSFALLTDLHVEPGSSNDSSLNRIVKEINNSSAEFTVVTGDLTNTGSDLELLAVKSALNKLIKPCYVLPGNHETNWSESAGLTFNKLWGNDRFIFKHHGFIFTGLNTGPFMKMGDGHVKQEDITWLSQQLQQNKNKDEVLISFTHYPLNDGLDDWPQVTDVLKSFGCRLSFCGHGHRLALYNFAGIPGIMGRALFSGNSSPPGYNIIILRNDSALIYNKGLSESICKPAIAINYLKPDTLSTLPASPLPDFSVNNVFQKLTAITEWSDSASIFSGPCLVNDSILVYGNSLGWLKAISISSGRILWRRQIPGPVYSTPVFYGGILISGTIDGRIIGLDAFTGRHLWSVVTGSPVLAEGITLGGFVYIGGGDRKFYKIEIATGKVIWQSSDVNGIIQGKPALCGSNVLFGAWDTYLYCLDIKTGNLNWKWSNGKSQKLFSPGNITPVCSGNRVFIVAPDRFMTAIDITSGKEVWRTNKHQVRESLGISPDGEQIYAKLMNDSVIAVSASANFPETVWSVNAGFGYEHNPCPVLALNDAVIIGTRNGMLFNIDPGTSQIIWKYKPGISSVNKIVADNRKTLWFTMTEGKIIGIKTIHNQ